MGLIKHLPGKTFVHVDDSEEVDRRQKAAELARQKALATSPDLKGTTSLTDLLARYQAGAVWAERWWEALLNDRAKWSDRRWLMLTPDEWNEQAEVPVRARLASGDMRDRQDMWHTEWLAGKVYWAYQGQVYETTDAELTPRDVAALANEGANRRRMQLEKAHALQAMTSELDRPSRRQSIPQDVKIAVWQRDAGRCIECESNTELEFDHIIPLAMGGANTLRNLQLLCGPCNRRKGATLG